MAIGNLITVAEAAEIIGVSDVRVRQFIAKGRLKPAQTVGKMHFLDAAAVRKFAKKDRKPGRPKENIEKVA